MKIHPKVWKFLDRIMVLILAIVSYFFVADSLTDYSSNRTSISNEALPIKEQPSVSFCFGDENTVSLTWQLKIIDNNIFFLIFDKDYKGTDQKFVNMNLYIVFSI